MNPTLLTNDEEPTKVSLQRIRVASLAKWQTFAFFVLGIFAGIAYTTSFAVAGQISGIVVVWYFLLTPVMYAVVGLVSSIIFGLVYNSVAGRGGGIEVEVRYLRTCVPPPPPERWEGVLPKINECNEDMPRA
jgi:hypothetical protein